MVKHGLKRYQPPSTDGPSIAKKRLANTTIKSEATARDSSFTDVVLSAADAASYAEDDEGPAPTPAPAPQPASPVLPAAAAASASSNRTQPAAVAPAAVAPPASENGSEWGESHDLALVKALKTVPKDAADKWDQVAAAVGRSRAVCMKRFKEMKEKLKAKKSG